MPRVSVQYRTASKENYKRYCIENPEIDISYDKWKEVLYTYMSVFITDILETGDKNKLPWGFGSFSINKKRSRRTNTYNGIVYNNLPVDWVKSKQLGKRVYNMNYHTDGYRFRWVWFKTTCHFYHSDLYNFKPSREVSRLLATYLKKPNSQYKEIYREWVKK